MTSSLDETRNQKMFNRTSTSPIKNFNFRKVHDKESISNTVLNSPIKKYPNKSAFRLYTFTNSHTRKSSKDLSQKMIRIEGLTKDVSHSRKTSEKNLKSSLTHKNASVNQFKHGSKLFGDQKWALDTISNLTKMIEDKITSKTPTNRAIIPSKIQEIDHKDKQLKIDDQSQTIEQQKALNTIKMRKKYQEEVTEIYMRLIADKKRAMSKIVDNLMQRHTEEVE